MSKNRMTKKEISVAFAELLDLVDQKNRELKKRKEDIRFIPMQHIRKDRLQEFGLYDYKTKRYTLGSIHSGKAVKILAEMKSMLNKV